MNMSARIALVGLVSIVLIACGPRGTGGTGGGTATGGSGGTAGGTGTAGGSGTAGGTVLPCAQSCAGCCSTAGTCQPGNTTNACGRQGAMCAACTGAQTCNAQSECVDTTCMGCVAAGGCVATAAQTNSQCGTGGISCIDCSANGGTCDAGTCEGGTCNGCRDTAGRCQPGNTNGACGTAGAVCATCGSGTACQNGSCQMIGGTGGGSGAGGGSGTGGGGEVDAGQVAALKAGMFCGTSAVRIVGAVVVAVQGTTLQGTNVRQNFWVVEPSSPQNGLYVFKDYTDTVEDINGGGPVTSLALQVGDLVNIDGHMTRIFPDSFINNGAEAYRYQMSELCNGMPMRILLTGTATPPADIMAASPFGLNPDGGKPKGNFVSDQRPGVIQPMAGVRVHIPGPLTLSNPYPPEMVRINNPATSFGFEVSGANVPAGVLVRTQNTFGTFPDGGPRCDYGRMVADGGRMVAFPQGIRGVWDTFSQTGCTNGTTTCSGIGSRDAGIVPGLGSNYTFAIFPIDCNDLAGAVVTP